MANFIESTGIPDVQVLPGVTLSRRLKRDPYGDSVYLGTRTENQEEVIVKLRMGSSALSANAIERFQREYFALSTLNSQHVQRAYEFSRDNEHIALCLESVSTESLGDVLENQAPILIPEVVRILKEIARGLHDIHSGGIIHANLSPENILFSKNGNVKISQFGQCVIQDPGTTTHIGEAIAAYAYASPEYFEFGNIDGRFDIYSFGLLAFEILTGRQAFSSKNPLERIEQRISHEIKDPEILRPDAPVWLLDLIRDAARRNPSERIRNTLELKARIADENPGKLTTHVDGRVVMKRVVSTVRGFVQKRAPVIGFSHVSNGDAGVYVHKSRRIGKSDGLGI